MLMPRKFSELLHLARRFRQGWVILYFTVLAVLFTYPLIRQMGDAIVGQIGDNIYFIWLIRWYNQALFSLHTSPFFNANLNFPAGWNLASTDTVPAIMLYAVPLSWLGGATWAYNLALLLGYILSGWIMFLWLREMTGSTWAGLVGGTLFAFSPNHQAHLVAGHLNLASTQWFPLYFWALYRLLRAPRFAWKPALVAALSLGLISGVTPYYIYMTILFSGVFVAAWLWQEGRQVLRLALWQNLAVLGGAGAVLALIPMLPYLSLNQQGGLASRSINYASSLAASPTDFILPSTDHFLWGTWIGAHFDRSLLVEATLYVGVVGGLLALLAWIKRKESGAADLFTPAVWVIVISFILALGPHLLWLNQKVVLPLPGFLAGLLAHRSISIPLPGLFLFQYFPLYDKMRALARFGFFALFFISVLAGLGAAWLMQKLPERRRIVVALVLLGLILVDFYPGPYATLARIDARPVDYWLAQQPGDGAVAQFPIDQEVDQDQVYNSSVHGKPYIGGFFSANVPSQYLDVRPALSEFPSTDAITTLRRLGVEYMVVDASQYVDFSLVDRQIRALGLQFAANVAGQYVYLFP